MALISIWLVAPTVAVPAMRELENSAAFCACDISPPTAELFAVAAACEFTASPASGIRLPLNTTICYEVRFWPDTRK